MGRTAARQAVMPLVILASLGFGIPAQFTSCAATAEVAAASPAGTYTVDLNYQETDEVLVSRGVGFKFQAAPFRKEPALPGQNVFRGSLLWGPRSEQALPFIWDKGRGRLLLDLNRNHDLTDDPKGSFFSASRGDNQSFTNVHLVFPTATGNRAMRLQLDFNSYQGGGVGIAAGLCSYWQARLSLHGKEWQFGVVETMPDGKAPELPQYLLWRPWAERQRAFHLITGSPDFWGFTKNVFFDHHAYELDWRYEPRSDSPRYRITLREQAPRLAELKVTGADLHRLILTAKPAMTVVLDEPAGTVKLPVGRYSLDEIWLRRGETEVVRVNAGTIIADPQCTTTLVAGGPLTNSVEGRPEGDALNLRYRLLGADGGEYWSRRPDYQHPFEVVVFQGTNRLGTCKFTFGCGSTCLWSGRGRFTNVTQVTAVSYADLSALGEPEGIPLAFTWSPAVPRLSRLIAAAPKGLGLLAALLLLLPLFLFRANRASKAWWIWLPVGLILVAGITLVFLLTDYELSLPQAVCAFVTGLAAVWLLMPYLKGRRRIWTFFKTLPLMAGFSLLAFLPSLPASEGGWFDLRPILAGLLAVASLAVTLALMFTGLFFRRGFGRVRFVCWLAVGTVVAWTAMATPFFIIGLLTSGVEWGAGFLAILCLSAETLAALLPLALLCCFQPFYRDRLIEYLKIAPAGVIAGAAAPPRLSEVEEAKG